MKYLTFTALAVIGLVANATTINGYGTLSNTKTNNLTVNGNATLNNVTITNDTSVNGKATIEDSELNTVNISGFSEIENSKIGGNISVNGRLQLEATKFNGSALTCSGSIYSKSTTYNGNLVVSGKLLSKNDIFNQELNISGKINANKSTFNKPINLNSELSSFKHSKINTSITVNLENKKNSQEQPWYKIFLGQHQSPAKVILADTTVSGDVNFIGKSGIIILKDNAKILGAIKNAQIQKSDE